MHKSMNHISLTIRKAGLTKLLTAQYVFWLIPGLINCAGVTGRCMRTANSAIRHAQNVVSQMAGLMCMPQLQLCSLEK